MRWTPVFGDSNLLSRNEPHKPVGASVLRRCSSKGPCAGGLCGDGAAPDDSCRQGDGAAAAVPQTCEDHRRNVASRPDAGRQLSRLAEEMTELRPRDQATGRRSVPSDLLVPAAPRLEPVATRRRAALDAGAGAGAGVTRGGPRARGAILPGGALRRLSGWESSCTGFRAPPDRRHQRLVCVPSPTRPGTRDTRRRNRQPGRLPVRRICWSLTKLSTAETVFPIWGGGSSVKLSCLWPCCSGL